MAVRVQNAVCRSRSRKRAVWAGRPRTCVVVACALLAAFAAGCDSGGAPGGTPDTASTGARLRVVAAENFWGSIAAQLGGAKGEVTSIIVNPDTDPHSYEPTAQDARTMAGAQTRDRERDRLRQLGAASCSRPARRRPADRAERRRTAGPEGGRQPAPVVLTRAACTRVIEQIVADYDRLDPADAAYFAAQEQRFETHGARALQPAAQRRSARATRACRSATARASSSRSAKTSG